MRARDIMSHPVFTVTPDTPARVASGILTENRISSLPVLDPNGRIVGMVSELDLLRDRLPHDPRQWLSRNELEAGDPPMSVRDVMTEVVVCMPDFTDAADLAQAMVESNIRAIPIINGVDLVGIVSRRDLLRTLLRDDVAIRTEVRQRLTEFMGDPARWKVEVEEGIVNIHGEFDDPSQKDVVTTLARTVPGVVRVHVRPKWFGPGGQSDPEVSSSTLT
jgi:CBS domain-containing protein